jgi:hypothetical protein
MTPLEDARTIGEVHDLRVIVRFVDTVGVDHAEAKAKCLRLELETLRRRLTNGR